jgi:hypothetical protein
MPTLADVERFTDLLQESMRVWFKKIQANPDPSVASALQAVADAPTIEESARLLYLFFDEQALYAVKDADGVLGQLWPLLAYYTLDAIDWSTLTEWVLANYRNQEFAKVAGLSSVRK